MRSRQYIDKMFNLERKLQYLSPDSRQKSREIELKAIIGARISANLYSLTETAKELGLDPELYFQWVLEKERKLSNSTENWAAMLIPHKALPKCRSVIIEIT